MVFASTLLLIASLLSFPTASYGQIDDLSLLLGFKPLPNVARQAIAQAQWSMETDLSPITQRFENFHDKLISWSESEKNRNQCQDSLMEFAFDVIARKAYTTKGIQILPTLTMSLFLMSCKHLRYRYMPSEPIETCVYAVTCY